jgi:hypothetical protein
MPAVHHRRSPTGEAGREVDVGQWLPAAPRFPNDCAGVPIGTACCRSPQLTLAIGAASTYELHLMLATP